MLELVVSILRQVLEQALLGQRSCLWQSIIMGLQHFAIEGSFVYVWSELVISDDFGRNKPGRYAYIFGVGERGPQIEVFKIYCGQIYVIRDHCI